MTAYDLTGSPTAPLRSTLPSTARCPHAARLASLLTFGALATLAALASLAAGCADDIAEPYELGHARLLAIRTEPAVLPPSSATAPSEASLDVLFTDGVAAAPRLATAAELTLALPAALDRPELRALLERRADGWHLRAPDEATLQAARAELALPEGAPVSLPIEVTVTPADGAAAPLHAQKLVTFGTFVGNPEPPRLHISDQPVPSALEARVAIPHGAEVALRAELPAEALAGPPDDVTYRWFSTFGELRYYTQPLALISAEADERDHTGGILVVARTPAGGVSWKFVATEVTD